MVKKYMVVMTLALILAMATIGTASAHFPWEGKGSPGDGNTAAIPGDPCTTKGNEPGTIQFNHHSGKEMCRR